MAQRSSVEKLPTDVRHELERKLAENGFGNYTELADWLKSQGYEISRSAVHRYGSKVQKRFASIKASTEAARLIAEGASDEGDTRSEALVAMVQTELFEAMIEIGDIADLSAVERFNMIAKVSKNVASLTSASTRLKKFQSELKDKMDKAFEKLEAQSKQGTLDEHTLKRIRTEVYGLIG
ncbi:DUF3486 family protein [Moraxella bovis]|uniref:Protein of uncharacterized function (DUF3486) n=1 Tax=Moraxella bovis TaxID=476 RepID=A0A378PWV2_MORBO|nr:DUF3486 family protein [Moraxella bovis]STY93093.1 Protein of uncharacterised function (DUF3486) [Moraxella bovis]